MGETDLMQLYKIKKWVKDFDAFAFNFIVDTNTLESRTGILINEYGTVIKSSGISESDAKQYRKDGFKPFVPDLIDFKNKLIIEWQEEPKPNKGAKIIKKGHDEFSDSDKDLYYKLAGFKQLKLWESFSDEENKKALIDFLGTSA